MTPRLGPFWPCFVFVLGCSTGIQLDRSTEQSDPVADVLRTIGLERDDLTIDGRRLADPDRLEITISLLNEPLNATIVARELTQHNEIPNVGEALDIGGRLLGLHSVGESQRFLDSGSELPEDLHFLRPLFSALTRCKEIVRGACAKFSLDEWRTLQRIPDLVHPEQPVPEWEADSLIVLARRFDIESLTNAAKDVVEAIELFRTRMKSGLSMPEYVRISGLTTETTAGRVVVAGIGDDVHTVPAFLTVDLGGNDRYSVPTGVSSEQFPVSVCIDIKGNDIYSAIQGRGVFGIGILRDEEGDDVYTSGSGGQGAGMGGIGILDDRAGNDTYRSTFCSQGFGLYGIGLLVDGSGSDRYEGNLLMQGAAGPGGFGGLWDGGGDDHYFSGGRYPDFREEGAFLSMSQGFSMGIRPLASGGAALLLDEQGDDRYEADYFAQGASDWGGLGMLIDRSGEDRYMSRRYAQGCGTHLSVGLLMDDTGNDDYILWGVGQGCGHDLSVGILHDFSGDDAYRGSFLCQGVGNANGIGLLQDMAGSDTYSSEQGDCRGFGNPSRDYGSVGLFVDHEGNDRYIGQGGNGQVWSAGVYGAGYDLP